MRTIHRRHNTSAYLSGCGCATLTGPVFLFFGVFGLLTSIWFVTHLAAVLSTILALAVVGNSLAAMLGLTSLSIYLLVRQKPTKRATLTSPVHIEEVKQESSRAAIVLPEVPLRVAPRALPRIATPAPEAHVSRKQTSVYWDGRRIGWEDANGGLHFDRKTPV